MIFDNIRNKARYLSLHPDIDAVFARLESMTAESEAGRYPISDNAFVNHMTITTIPEEKGIFEGHARYADLQFVVEGCEVIDYCDGKDRPLAEDKLAESDLCIYESPENYTRHVLHKGDFVLLFPGEAHRPGVAFEGIPYTVVKSVGKLKF
jgi:biofilm protein TabA